jgi:hypothetical protein
VAHGVGHAVESVIEGKSDAIRLALTVLLPGHLLIEDVGVNETMLAKALARSTGCSRPAHPVHPGPAAQRHSPGSRLQPGEPRVQVQEAPTCEARTSWSATR